MEYISNQVSRKTERSHHVPIWLLVTNEPVVFENISSNTYNIQYI